MNELISSELVLRVLPGGSISTIEDEERKSGLFCLFFNGGIERFDSHTIGAPLYTVLILVTGEEDDSLRIVSQ